MQSGGPSFTGFFQCKLPLTATVKNRVRGRASTRTRDDIRNGRRSRAFPPQLRMPTQIPGSLGARPQHSLFILLSDGLKSAAFVREGSQPSRIAGIILKRFEGIIECVTFPCQDFSNLAHSLTRFEHRLSLQ